MSCTESHVACVTHFLSHCSRYYHLLHIALPLIHSTPRQPENILFVHTQPNLTVRITDFGYAVLLRAQRDKVTGAGGTLGFCSPEILRREQFDEKADIWAVGVILFLMLTARTPFGDPNDVHFPRYVAARRPLLSLAAFSPAVQDLMHRLFVGSWGWRWGMVCSRCPVLQNDI